MTKHFCDRCGKETMKQTERVLKLMRDMGWITQYDAFFEIGVMRLASRISDLKREGYNIESRMKTVTNRYGEKCAVKEYRLAVAE